MSTSDAMLLPRDAVLIAFKCEAAQPASLADMAQALLGPSDNCLVCLALDEPRVTAYLHGAKASMNNRAIATEAAARVPGLDIGDIEVCRLSGIRVFRGASNKSAPFYRYVVHTDVARGGEEDLERWYDEEHMPGLAGVPGVVLAQRLVSLDAGPRYYACYDLIDPTVLQSPEWLAVRATDWSSRVRPTFRNTRRVMSRRLLEM